MERKPHVSLEFKRLSIPEKTVFGKNVYEQMLANAATFDNPDVKLDDLLAINTALFDAAEAAKTGDFAKVAAMHTAEKTWDATYTTEAHYVDRKANGQKDTILLSGFKATTSETKPAQKCAAATGIKAQANLTTAGAVHIECDVIPGAVAYVYIISTDQANLNFKNNQMDMGKNPSVVIAMVDTHRKVDFQELPGGTPLWLRIIGVNSVGLGEVSQPVGFKVL